MNYYSHHIGDYKAKTDFLTNEQDICYRRLLEMYYKTELPIPNETQSVSIRLRVGCDSLEFVLKFFFRLESDGWHNKRCDEEIAEYRKKCEKNRGNGQKGGRPKSHPNRVKKPSGFPVGYVWEPNSNPTQTQNNPNQEPITNNQDITKANALVLGDKSPTPSKRATQLSDDWKPTEKHRELARRESKDCDREAEQFKDHHKARGNTFKDWNLAFNTWLRNNYGSSRPTIKPDHRAEKRAREFPELIEVPDL